MSASKKLLIGSASNVLNLVLQVASGFIMMPITVHALGESLFGIWTLFAVFMGYYSLLDFGLTNAVSRFVSKAIGQNEKKDVAYFSATAFYIFIAICLVAILLAVIATFFTHHLFSQSGDTEVFNNLLYVFCLNALIIYPTSVFGGLLTSHMRYDIINALKIITTALKLFGTILLLKAGYGIYSLAALATLSNLIENLPKIYFAYKVDDSFSVSYKNFNPTKLKELFGYSLYTFIANLADVVRFQIPPFLITMYINLAAVTHFRVGARLIELYTLFIVSVFSVLMPYFSQKHGESNHSQMHKNFIFSLRVCTVMTTFIGLSIILYGQKFIDVWMGKSYQDSYSVLVILTVGYLFALSQNPSLSFLLSIGKQKFLAFTNVAEAIFNFILSLVLIKKFGIIGAASAIVIPMVISKLLIQTYFVSREMGTKHLNFIGITLVQPILISAIIFVIFGFIVNNYLVSSYLSIASWGLIHLFIFSILCFIFLMNKEEKNRISALFQKIIHKKS